MSHFTVNDQGVLVAPCCGKLHSECRCWQRPLKYDPTPPAANVGGDAYGHCPHCGAPGQMRERRLGGNDVCANGCVYPSRDALVNKAVSEV